MMEAGGFRYLDVCSGISAPTMAWKPLGWEALCFAEIEAAPRAVLSHHYPDVPLRGDFTEIQGDEYGPVDLLVGGTPCQSFSVAGFRGGLADERGNLALEYLRLADRARPRWLVWENVPGVLSSNGGRDFGTFLGGMGELGYGFAYRVLDAQHFGVPQRRRRVFVVGYLGDWRRAAAVLFERHSLQGHPPPRREAGERVAGTLKACAGKSGTPNGAEEADRLVFSGQSLSCHDDLAPCLDTGAEHHNRGIHVAHSLRAEGFDASEDGTGRGTPLVPVAFQSKASPSNSMNPGPVSPAIDVGKSDGLAVCFTAKDHGADAGELAPTLRAGGHSGSHANAGVMPAVAFTVGVHKGWAPMDVGASEEMGNTLTKTSIQGVALSAETMYGVSHADAAQTYPDQTLRALRDAVGEEAYSEWCLGVLTAFRTPEVLQSAVHGGSFRRQADKRNELGDDPLPRQEAGRGGTVLALWQAGCDGRSPRGWQPSEQLARELVAHLSELPHQRASAARFLLGLWRSSEGLGSLREALSALQEAWRPAQGEDQPARLTSAVRRFTPRECERLMGFPDDFTLVPYRRGMMADGPRYKMLGNSMAVPVIRWIGERIQLVEAIATQAEAA